MTDATDLDEAAIRARVEAATEGPWRVVVDHHRGYDVPEVSVWSDAVGAYVTEDVVVGDSQFLANAEFIAHARADVELLLNVVAEQRAVLARVRALLDLYESWDGTRPHPGESSPRQRDQLRAALDGADITTTEPPECDHPGIEHSPFSATGICPRCGRCKFIGHGPLCGDCLTETTTDGDTVAEGDTHA